MKDVGHIVIVGAGPAGLGAAHRLRQLGYEQFVVLETLEGPGGLSASTTDTRGFTWDAGGHIFFGGDAAYNARLDGWASEWMTHRREARVWVDGHFLPYPIQHHTDELGCEAHARGPRVSLSRPRFQAWLENEFGPVLLTKFFVPYNRKVWGYPLDLLEARPIVDRVATGGRSGAWGPNATFRYPRGGSGTVWQTAAEELWPRVIYDAALTHVDPDQFPMDLAVIGAQPRRLGAHVVISSMPLPRLIRMTSGLTDDSYGAASLLRSSTLYVIGFGMRGPVPPELEDITWWYDPDPHTPYHRVTVLSQQAPGLAPEGCWSLMAEVCETEYKPIPAKLVQQCAQALQRWVDPESIISTWEWRFPIAYPTPMFNRDQALAVIHPELERHRIFSVGRFGGWRYEMGNMDQCFQQGVDVVDRLLEVVA